MSSQTLTAFTNIYELVNDEWHIIYQLFTLNNCEVLKYIIKDHVFRPIILHGFSLNWLRAKQKSSETSRCKTNNCTKTINKIVYSLNWGLHTKTENFL